MVCVHTGEIFCDVCDKKAIAISYLDHSKSQTH